MRQRFAFVGAAVDDSIDVLLLDFGCFVPEKVNVVACSHGLNYVPEWNCFVSSSLFGFVQLCSWC